VLVDGADPDRRSGALVALLSASDVLPALNSEIPWSGPVYTRGKQIQQGEWGAAAAGDAVIMTATTILSSGLFVAVTLPGLRED
jgi:hypothetical protein